MSPSRLEQLSINHNLLAGSIPPQLMDGQRSSDSYYMSASGLHHEGTIPLTASRMTMKAIWVSLGH
eukprot:3485808-Amphidinium_carterae.1